MQTEHAVHTADARSLSQLDDDSVELVVTSPPYPMIEMWDDAFTELNDAVGEALESGDGSRAFELMHDELDKVWAELRRVLVDGGIACINIGDATRKIGGQFELFPNHAAIIDRFRDHGFQSLPTIHWRKPTNKKTKFMGSGMVPPNAYVTLEHEKILIFRNGGRRRLEAGSDRRYEAAYFWEERNQWFTDMWEDVAGADQSLDADTRERAAVYPVEVPYRLINMFSVYGDRVLDPFLGTGTTSVAAMMAARDSVGYEVDSELVEVFRDRVGGVPDRTRSRLQDRLEAHREFAAEADCGYEAEHYDFPVKTKQERRVRFYEPTRVKKTLSGFTVEHTPYEPTDDE